MTICRLLESDQRPAKGTLTASALADNTKGLTFHDLKGYIIDGFDCLAPFLAFKINFDMVGFHQHFFVICCRQLTLLLLGCIRIQPASYLTFFRQLYNRRLALLALFCRMRTSRPETASRNLLCRIRHNTLNGLKGRTILCNSRNRTHQADCIRMLRIIEKLSNRGFFNNSSGIHNNDRITQLTDNT